MESYITKFYFSVQRNSTRLKVSKPGVLNAGGLKQLIGGGGAALQKPDLMYAQYSFHVWKKHTDLSTIK
jgi:hypothetical protein